MSQPHQTPGPARTSLLRDEDSSHFCSGVSYSWSSSHPSSWKHSKETHWDPEGHGASLALCPPALGALTDPASCGALQAVLEAFFDILLAQKAPQEPDLKLGKISGCPREDSWGEGNRGWQMAPGSEDGNEEGSLSSLKEILLESIEGACNEQEPEISCASASDPLKLLEVKIQKGQEMKQDGRK